MDSPHRAIGIAEYAEGSLNDVRGRVTTADVALGIEASLSPEVVTVLLRIAVMSAVELVQRPRARHLHVDAGDELAVLAPDLDLGLHLDADDEMQQTEQGLPRRFGAVVGPRNCTQQGLPPSSMRRADCFQLFEGHVTGMERTVDQDDQVEEREPPRAGENRLCRSGAPETCHVLVGNGAGMPAGPDAGPQGPRVIQLHRDEDGSVIREWRQHPATDPGRSERSEAAMVGQQQLPAGQISEPLVLDLATIEPTTMDASRHGLEADSARAPTDGIGCEIGHVATVRGRTDPDPHGNQSAVDEFLADPPVDGSGCAGHIPVPPQLAAYDI